MVNGTDHSRSATVHFDYNRKIDCRANVLGTEIDSLPTTRDRNGENAVVPPPLHPERLAASVAPNHPWHPNF